MSVLFNKKPIVINAELASYIGLNEAIVIQQLHYWISETGSGVSHKGRRWVYNTYDDWQQQFPFWSPQTIKRALTSLRKSKLVLVEQLNKAKHDRTNFYAIDYAALDEAFSPIREDQCDSIEKVNLTSSKGSICSDLTEITTEITTDNKTPYDASGDAVASYSAPQPSKKKGQTDYPDSFEELWTIYPKRSGDNPKKGAFSAWRARQKEGVTHDDMLEGTKRYAAYCLAEGNVGTRFVKQAKAFLGPERPFTNDWTPSRTARPVFQTNFKDADYSSYDTSAKDWLGDD